MNNYVSKEVAIGLEEIGFKELCWQFFNEPGEPTLNRPDFLITADWLWKNHEIKVRLNPESTTIISSEIIERFFEPDHRNTAIARAIEIIRERRRMSS